MKHQGQGYEHQKFSQQEDRNGYQTHGEYSVELPDGRTQRVVYQVRKITTQPLVMLHC